MDKINWSELTPRERDCLIAEKVFGHTVWRDSPFHGDLMLLDNKQGLTGEVPHYSTDMNTAWKIVRKMNISNSPDFPDFTNYHRFIEELTKIVGSDMFFDLFYCDQDGDHLSPERICIAALRAVGIEVKQ